MSKLNSETIEILKRQLRGNLLTPEEAGYDEARTIWNAMIDRKPALIAECTGVADIMSAVNFARDNDLLAAVRGAGHNIACKAIADDALMIDLSGLKSVRIDPGSRRAYVGPGATLGDIDKGTE